MDARVVGAVNFKDWYHSVWLTEGTAKWPQKCACCMRRPQGTQPIVLQKRPFSYPICNDCRRHGKIAETGLIVAIVIGLVLPAVLFLVFVGIPRSGALPLLGLAYLFCVLVIAGLVYWPLHMWSPGKSAQCADSGWPIEEEPPHDERPLGGEKAERTDERQARLFRQEVVAQHGAGLISMKIRNPIYLREWIQANGGFTGPISRIEAKM